MATAVDNGKFMQAKRPGNCDACGRAIVPGNWIYFSSGPLGVRHQACVDGEAESPAAEARQPAAADAASRDDTPRATAARDGQPGLPFGDDAARAARVAAAAGPAVRPAAELFRERRIADLLDRLMPPLQEAMPLLRELRDLMDAR